MMKFYIIDHGDNSVGIDSYVEEVTVSIPKKRMNSEFYKELTENLRELLTESYTESTIIEVLTETEYNKQAEDDNCPFYDLEQYRGVLF